MLALFREGFWRDALALVVAAVVAGAFAAGGLARGVEAYFTQAVTGLVGAPGEYDAIVHLKHEAGAEALDALADRMQARFPGSILKEGPELAGYVNVLIRLPQQQRTRAGFESLDSAFRDVPGFDGITYIVEPAVVVKDVHPTLQSDFIRRAQAERGVAFSFASGSSVWAVLQSADDAARVQRSLEEFAASLAVLDVRLPIAMTIEARDALARDVMVGLEAKQAGLRLTPVHADGQGGDSDGSLEADLLAARAAIEALGELDAPRLRARLFEAADLIEGAFSAGALADGPGGEGRTGQADMAYVIDAFRRSVDQLELLEARLREVAVQLRDAAEQGQASDVLIALLIQRLIERLGGEREIEPPEPAVDVRELRAGIDALAERLSAWEQLDPGRIADSLRELAAALPSVEPGAVQRITAILDALAPSGQTTGDRLLIVARGVRDPGVLQQEGAAALDAAVRDSSTSMSLGTQTEAVKGSARVYVQKGGVVQPDARTAVLQLLAGARRVVTLLIALLVFVVVFLFDVTVLLGFARRTAEVDGESRGRVVTRTLAWGGMFGAVTLTATVWLGAGGEPIGGAVLPLAGGLLGALLALASERLGPVDRNQFLSALSLGIASDDILKEVMIPAGRPGLLYWLTHPGRKLGRTRVFA